MTSLWLNNFNFQLNMASDTFDLSQLYGRTDHIRHNLRLRRDGKLKVDSNDFLPATTDSCFSTSEGPCFQSGDSRVNVNPYMTIQHSIFHKSHNRIASKLKALNPQWKDEKLFETARKINIAIYQKISYEEWLPMVVGRRLSAELGNVSGGSHRRGVSNEFATAAIRFYNSMLPGDLWEEAATTRKLFELRESFYKPQQFNWTQRSLRMKMIHSVLRQKAMGMDSAYVDDVSNWFIFY